MKKAPKNSKAAHVASIQISVDWEGDLQFKVEAEKPSDNEAFNVAIRMIKRYLGPSAEGTVTGKLAMADGSTKSFERPL